MKKLHLLLSSAALTLLLSVSASAGVMTTNSSQPPPPPPATTSVVTQNTEVETLGIMEAGVAEPVPVAEIALSVLQSVLALF